MNDRHLTDAEKQILRVLADQAGYPEVLRTLGQMIANDHPDLHLGTDLRSMVNKVASDVKTVFMTDRSPFYCEPCGIAHDSFDPTCRKKRP